jgi:hypothetical protein
MRIQKQKQFFKHKHLNYIIMETKNTTAASTKKATVTARAAKKATMTKFEKILSASGQELLDMRGQLVSRGAAGALQDKITQLSRQADVINLEILNITDLSVRTNDSLCPGGKNFDAVKWVDRMGELHTELAVINDDLTIYEAIQLEYFTVECANEVATV